MQKIDGGPVCCGITALSLSVIFEETQNSSPLESNTLNLQGSRRPFWNPHIQQTLSQLKEIKTKAGFKIWNSKQMQPTCMNKNLIQTYLLHYSQAVVPFPLSSGARVSLLYNTAGSKLPNCYIPWLQARDEKTDWNRKTRKVVDKRKRCAHTSLEHRMKEGTASVCVHDGECFKMCKGTLVSDVCVARFCVHLQSFIHQTPDPFSVLRQCLTFTGKTHYLSISYTFFSSDMKFFKRILMRIQEFLIYLTVTYYFWHHSILSHIFAHLL